MQQTEFPKSLYERIKEDYNEALVILKEIQKGKADESSHDAYNYDKEG